MEEDMFLGVFGMYILEAKIFDYLETDINNNNRDRGEFQLTNCLEKMRQDRGMTGYLVKGQYFDTGMPLFYRQAMIDFFD
jgi:UTP--glucose-1-phosphate uridylyltransferase